MAVTSELWAHILGPDYLCRGVGCDEVAEFKVVVPEYIPHHIGPDGYVHPYKSRKDEEWGGRFCLRCLTRALEIRLNMVNFHQPVTIERINRP